MEYNSNFNKNRDLLEKLVVTHLVKKTPRTFWHLKHPNVELVKNLGQKKEKIFGKFCKHVFEIIYFHNFIPCCIFCETALNLRFLKSNDFVLNVYLITLCCIFA